MKRFNQFITEKIELHETLNPALWNSSSELRPGIRDRLLSIARAWAKYANIPEQMIRDVYLCGGNANYNYTIYSDIDIHVVVNRAALGFGPMVDDYLKDKKALWGYLHKGIQVMGYPVELYAQDMAEPTPANQGVYSLLNKKWVIVPSPVSADSLPNIDKKLKDLQSRIDLAIKAQSYEQLVALKKDISRMRKAGIAVGGEFSPENLVFKSLRNDGYLQKMTDFMQNYEDAALSYRDA